MRISDWSSDVCSSDLAPVRLSIRQFAARCGLSADTLRYYEKIGLLRHVSRDASGYRVYGPRDLEWISFILRSEEHTSELQSLMHISYAVFCLKKKKNINSIQAYIDIYTVYFTDCNA